MFACLAKAVGVGGCAFEHQLQAVRVALNPITGDPNSASYPPINPQNVGFLRQRAYLGIVFVTDEDDCSADPDNQSNHGFFVPKTPGDTVSLRCAARGHVCNGKDVPDYIPDTGYMGQDPFVARFADCEAKDDTNLPLIRVRDMIDSVEQAKIRPGDQIFAAGIIGWPQGDLSGAEYRIDKDETAQPVEQRKLWDYMPVCQNADLKSADGNIYKAYGGLRLKKFLDRFKGSEKSNLFSVCNPDFSDAMTEIGKSIGRMMRLGCMAWPLVDTDLEQPGLQPECKVVQMVSCDDPGKNGCRSDGYIENPIDLCRDKLGRQLDPEAPQTDEVSSNSRPCWYLKHDTGDFGCSEYPGGLMPKVLTADGKPVPPGSLLRMSCLTCPDGQLGCQVDR